MLILLLKCIDAFERKFKFYFDKEWTFSKSHVLRENMQCDVYKALNYILKIEYRGKWSTVVPKVIIQDRKIFSF